jgi:hypothetical protein
MCRGHLSTAHSSASAKHSRFFNHPLLHTACLRFWSLKVLIPMMTNFLIIPTSQILTQTMARWRSFTPMTWVVRFCPTSVRFCPTSVAAHSLVSVHAKSDNLWSVCHVSYAFTIFLIRVYSSCVLWVHCCWENFRQHLKSEADYGRGHSKANLPRRHVRLTNGCCEGRKC